jgi:CubicO group peptidase (beta-lactamase class C family)
MKKFTGVLKTIGIILLAIVVLVTGTALLAPKPPRPPEAAAGLAEVEAYFEELTAFGSPPGLSVVVVKDGEIVYNKAFGLADGPNNVPADPETTYHWWSVTKMFTATAIFQLQDEGKLDIDEPAVKYLPFFDAQYPSTGSPAITIRQLLNHSSGLPDNVPAVVGWMHLEGDPRLDQTALLQKELPNYSKLIFEPGTKSQYTNVGYMVLGAIIEQVSGQSYEEYVVEHILQPLKMDHTDFCYTDEIRPQAAVGMHPLMNVQTLFLPPIYGKRLPALVREVKNGNIWLNRICADSDPPTGLIGPAPDLARFVAAHLNGGELEGRRILSQASVASMMLDSYIQGGSLQTDYSTQGLGWEICGEGENLCLAHGGGGPGYASALRLYPWRSLGIVMIANGTDLDGEAILDLLAGLDW